MRSSIPKKTHIGPLPPPLGGISIYLDRLARISPSDRFINENTLSNLSFAFAIFRPNQHYVYHSPNYKRQILLFLICKITGSKYTIVSHGQGIQQSFVKANPLVRILMRRMLFAAHKIQAVGPRIKTFLEEVIRIPKDSVEVKNAYLPPPLEDEQRITESYTTETKAFVASREPLIIANASSIVFQHGVDLYGIDMCVNLMAFLSKRIPKAGLLFALAEVNDKDYLNALHERLETLGISDCFHFMTGQRELWPLFRHATLMVRPTYSDGFGISISEALNFGCTAVASDVCERAEGTVLFPNRNQDQFNQTCLEILDSSRKKLN